MANRIEKPNVMTREDVKNFLNINSSDYDGQIDFWLPIVTDDVERITYQDWVLKLSGDLTTASKVISDINTAVVSVGDLTSSVDTQQNKVTAIDDDAQTLTVTTAAGQDLDDTDIYVNVFPAGKKMIAAQMVWYQIQNAASDTKITTGFSSERWGNYNYSKPDADSGTVYGYPKSLVRGLATITAVRFC